MKTALACLIGLAVLLASAPFEVAMAGNPSAEERAEDQKMKEWQDRYRDLKAELEQAQLDLDTAQRTYSKGRQRNRLRGEIRGQTVAAIADAKARLEEAQRKLDEFPDEARRAGVPPGWLRAAED